MHRKTGEPDDDDKGEEQGAWFVDEMLSLMGWCKRVLIPLLSQISE